jgi:predicted DNA-binding protein (MmcQ/YjbR family)
MAIFDKAEFSSFASSLPATTLHEQWGALVAKVGGKVYSVFHVDEDSTTIAFKCPEETFEILTSVEGIGQAPYFAKRQWVAVARSASIPEEQLKDYVKASYSRVATSLTKKMQKEIGLTE